VSSTSIAVKAETCVPDRYINWLKEHNVPLFNAGSSWWRPYRHALIPASVKPEPIDLELEQAQDALRKSGTFFLRWLTRRSEEPTDFWYVACDRYEFNDLSGKMRTKIRRAYKDCSVRQIEASWLAVHGYDCYAAAFSRYKGGQPESRQRFAGICSDCSDGPFEFWGAYVGNHLAGFAKCIVGEDYVTMVSFKIHPGYLTSRPAYALLDKVLETYVTREGKVLHNGFRSIDHQTDMQEFVLQFGFRREYCDLKIVYRPLVGMCVGALYPFKQILDLVPTTRHFSQMKTLLAQEKIRRSFL
jgi:hypothetical protein